MNEALHAAARFQRRIALVLAVRQVLRDLTLFAIVWGVVTLITRTLFDRAPFSPWWGAAALPLVIAVAAMRGARLRPSMQSVIALLDAESHAGGLLLASETMDVGAWQSSLADVAQPRIRYDAARTGKYAAASALFAIAALFVPQREGAASHHRLDIKTDIARAESRLKLLEEEKLLPPDRAEALKQSVDQLKREASGDDPAKAWEMLDALAEATARASREAAEAALRKTEALSRVEAMAAVLEGDQLSGDDLAGGMRTLANEASQPEVVSSLPDDVKDAIAHNSLTDAQLRQIANAARSGKQALRNTLNKLRAAGLIDPKSLAKQEQAADAGDKSDLANYLKENAKKQGMGNALQAYMAGRGGVNRGRGDAAMFFGEQSDDSGAKWKNQELPPTAAALENSRIEGVSAAAPDASHAKTSAGGALTNATAGGGSAYTAVVLPRHRGTVKRYFERK